MPSKRLLLLTLLLGGTAALADPYDLRLFKLGNPSPNGVNFHPAANARFEAFARELAAGLTSVNLMPPETLGHAGFSISAGLSVVSFDQSEFIIPTERFNADRSGIDGALLLPSIHVRKGLPWSLEVGTRLAWVEKSRMAAATGEVKWAINEGFTYLPDLGVRGFATRLFNTKEFDLTAAGLDLGLGKQFAIGGMVTLTPYVGWNLVWVAASSDTVIFDPARPWEQTVASPSAPFNSADGVPQTGVFEEVRLRDASHNRYYGGVRFMAGALQLGLEYSLSQLPTLRRPVPGSDQQVEQPLPSVTAVNFMVGLDF
jgi:hypothetical protein